MKDKTSNLLPQMVKLKPSRRPKHGGYSFIRSGKIPDDKREVERYLTWLRQKYIEDIGPREEDLSAGQMLLLNKLITFEGLTRCMEIEAARRETVNSPKHHSTYTNHILKICQMLGLERKANEGPDIQTYIREFDAAKEKRNKEGKDG